MPRLSLIRHGQTAWNVERRFLGWTDVPLDETGVSQARSRAADLGAFDAVFSSSSARAAQTAEHFGVPVLLPALRELDQGDLEGMHATDALEVYSPFFAEWMLDPTDIVIPGGRETFAQAQHRVLGALRALPWDGLERVAVVSHQMVIAAVQCAVDGVPLRRWRDYRVGHLEIVELDVVADNGTEFRRP